MKLNFFKAIVDAVTAVVKGIRNVNFPTLVIDLIGYIPNLIKEFSALLDIKKGGVTGQEAVQLINDGLEAFDNATGVDDDGNKKLSVIHGMPIEKQEETLDAFKLLIKNIMYCKAKVRGYYDGADAIDIEGGDNHA